MVSAGRITSIWRYPVKSMAGERIAAADLKTSGLHADRTWAVRDLELDATTSAKRLPGLLQCTARYAQAPPADAGPGNAPEVIVGLPGGQSFSSSDPAVHQAISDYLDRDVRLTPLPPVHARDQYRTPPATQADLRTIFGLRPDEPLPDLSVFPVRKLAEISRYATPVGSYVDAYPLHILTEQWLRTMAGLAPDSDFDVRRFRPSILVDSTGGGERPEWHWCGGVLRAPHAEIAPMIPTIRCVMPSHAQPGLDRDPEITRVLAAMSRRCLGVYATVTRPGRIAEGDVLQLDSPSQSAVASAAGSGVAKVKRAVLRAVTAGIPKGR